MKKAKKKDHLSFSSLIRFESCQRSGYENFVGRGKKASTTALKVGKLFHKFIELGGDLTLLNIWIDEQKDGKTYYKKNGLEMYSEYKQAIASADYFYNTELYEGLKKLHDSENMDIDLDDFAIQEYEVNGEVSHVPMKGFIDFIEVTPTELKIHDWKHIKDFKRVYDETDKRYKEWYERYIDQQMLYAFLFTQENPSDTFGKKIICEIVGVTKQDIPAIKQIQFEFEDMSELVSSTQWKLFTSRLRYAWKILNETTDETVSELQHCGECVVCRENEIVIKEHLEVD